MRTYQLWLLGLCLCSAAAAAEAPGQPRRYHDASIQFAETVIDSGLFRGEMWRHLLVLAWQEPLSIKDHALFIVSGGDAEELKAATAGARLPERERRRLGRLARASGMPVAMLRQVPNQPILGGKSEDAAIASTLVEYFKSGDLSWPLLLPMAKAVHAGFDALGQQAKALLGEAPRGYTLSGVSKRAWTLWLAAAEDQRIKAIVPQVFDVLSIRDQLAHQLQSWGTYSEQIGDYSEQGLPKMLGTPAGARLLEVIDPIAHSARLTMPKLLVMGSNDRYWPLDALNLYWSKLQGPKHVYYAAGETHDFKDQDRVDDNMVVLALAVSGREVLPKFDFRLHQGPRWQISSKAAPVAAVLWQAHAKTRDFRQARWQAGEVKQPGKNLRLSPASKAGHIGASYVELRYLVGGRPWHVTTTVGMSDEHGALLGP